ncbi:MAG: M56 family metallopeptidase, partial [Clostridia bacterium]|nr:M56 family metallopeptidase [Clostridia bacterium]
MFKDVFIYFLNCTVQCGILILYVILFRPIVRKASRKWSYMLWLPAAIRSVCTWTPSFLRLRNAILPRVDLFAGEMSSAGIKLYLTANATAHGDVLTHIVLPMTDGQNAFLLTAAALTWVLGVLFFAVKGIVSYQKLRINLRNAVLIRHDSYHVYMSDAVQAPFSLGIFYKRVYVPSGLSDTEMSMVTAHEYTHLDRRDPLWKLVAYSLRCIHWINPLFHIAYRLWGADMELTCDERVFLWLDNDQKPAYCSALLSVNQGRQSVFCPIAFSEGGIKGRVRNLLGRRKAGAIWTILAILIVVNIYRIGFTRNYGLEGPVRLPMDLSLRQSLGQALDILADDPEATEASEYFYLYRNTPVKPVDVTTDDQAYADWLSLITNHSVGLYQIGATVSEDRDFHYIVAIDIYPETIPDSSDMDPRTGTGRYIYLYDNDN